jgi:hypothetical protein
VQVDDLLGISEFAEESFMAEWNSSRSANDPLAGLPGTSDGFFWRICHCPQQNWLVVAASIFFYSSYFFIPSSYLRSLAPL